MQKGHFQIPKAMLALGVLACGGSTIQSPDLGAGGSGLVDAQSEPPASSAGGSPGGARLPGEASDGGDVSILWDARDAFVSSHASDASVFSDADAASVSSDGRKDAAFEQGGLDRTGPEGGERFDASRCSGPLTFADPIVEKIVRNTAHVNDGPILPAYAASVTQLRVESPDGIRSLDGIECLTNITTIDVQGRYVALDLTPLASLTRLETLYLTVLPGSDLSPLAILKTLKYLYVQDAGPADLSFVAS